MRLVSLEQRPIATQALGLTAAHVNRFGCYQSGIFASKSEFERQRMGRRGKAINLKTAKALGLTIPLPLLGRADEIMGKAGDFLLWLGAMVSATQRFGR